MKSSEFSDHYVASWAAFLPTVRVGGALPVTFHVDGDYVVAEMAAPYIPPVPGLSADLNKIPLGSAEGFPVPIRMSFKPPAFAFDTAAHFIRCCVRAIYSHEIDEQFRVNGHRPFAPKH